MTATQPLSRPKVIVFGAINIDLLATADHVAIRDDSTPGILRQSAGGVGRNVAENLTRLNIDTALVSCVGDDEFGRQILYDAMQIGIDVSGVSVEAGFATASYTAIHDRDGELLQAVSDMRIFDQFSIALSEELKASIATADAIVLDANLPEATLAAIVKACQSQTGNTKTIVADCVSRQKCTRLAGVMTSISLLKLNRAEAIALTGCTDHSNEALLEKLHQCDVANVVLTSGSDGVLYSNGAKQYHLPSLTDIDIVSTSGAGDAMLSGIVAARLNGLDIDEQLRWGTVAASVTLGVHSACAESLADHFPVA